ncbi:hypothetical protein XENTR_v10016691 [Xenopus tropicalis]|nr:hypothetical protein XENTR_v10016691 [Xenopus tropicalis]
MPGGTFSVTEKNSSVAFQWTDKEIYHKGTDVYICLCANICFCFCLCTAPAQSRCTVKALWHKCLQFYFAEHLLLFIKLCILFLYESFLGSLVQIFAFFYGSKSMVWNYVGLWTFAPLYRHHSSYLVSI